MGGYGVLWGPMGSYGALLAPMGAYGAPWGPMGPMGHNRARVGPYGYMYIRKHDIAIITHSAWQPIGFHIVLRDEIYPGAYVVPMGFYGSYGGVMGPYGCMYIR